MSKTQHPITDELLDQLLANYQNPEDLIGADGSERSECAQASQLKQCAQARLRKDRWKG